MSRRPLAVFGLISLFALAVPSAVAAPAPSLARPAAPPAAGTVTVRGVVTADFRDGLGGVFVEEAGDASRAGAFFVQAAPDLALAVGDRVEIGGAAAEAATGAPRAALRARQVRRLAARQALPVHVLQGPPADWAALENRHVRIAVPLFVAGSDRLRRRGELMAAFDGRLWQPSEIAEPGTPAFARAQADLAYRRVVLGGGHRRDADGAGYLPAGAAVRSGMPLADVEGIVVRGDDGGYRLLPTRPLAPPAPERAAAPGVAGSLRIAALNLENFFNGDGQGGGFPTLRGARTPDEYRAQLAKLVATVRPLQADVAAVMELENDGYGPASSLAQLVAALNAGQGAAGDWRFVDAGRGPGDNPIRVGLLYRASRVTPLGRPATLEGGPFGPLSRVPLAQAFRPRHGPAFVVVANHFKSKGCSEAVGADADQGDGQACWNATRTESARRLHAWLQTDPTGAGTELAALLGDFNAYAMEAPLRQLRADGWQDAFAVAGVARPYSFVYDGQSGRLDHALLSPALARRLRGAAEWHINADEQDEQGYRDANLPGPWRSSDHDPLLLGFAL